MIRRRGERTAHQNERDFPNIVELKVPPNGLGPKLDLIHEFHRQRGLDIRRGRGQARVDSEIFIARGFAHLPIRFTMAARINSPRVLNSSRARASIFATSSRGKPAVRSEHLDAQAAAAEAAAPLDSTRRRGR